MIMIIIIFYFLLLSFLFLKPKKAQAYIELMTCPQTLDTHAWHDYGVDSDYGMTMESILPDMHGGPFLSIKNT